MLDRPIMVDASGIRSLISFIAFMVSRPSLYDSSMPVLMGIVRGSIMMSDGFIP